MEITEFYKEISKKKGLPDFNTFNREFFIEDIKEGDFALRILEKIIIKIEKYGKIIEAYLNPDIGSIAELTELKNMSEDDKAQIRFIFIELILIQRNALIQELENKEDKIIDYIKSSYNKWNDLKPKLLAIINKSLTAWKDDSGLKDDFLESGYLG
jgi:hypothetical protein